MAIEQHGFIIGFLAAANSLATKQFYCVYVTSAAKWDVAGAGYRTVGIVQNAPGADEDAQVMMQGVSKAQAGGTITAGDSLTVDSNGKLIKSLDEAYSVGIALESAVSGEIFTAYLGGGSGTKDILSPA